MDRWRNGCIAVVAREWKNEWIDERINDLMEKMNE